MFLPALYAKSYSLQLLCYIVMDLEHRSMYNLYNITLQSFEAFTSIKLHSLYCYTRKMLRNIAGNGIDMGS